MPQYPPPLLVINDTMSAAWVLRHDATVELEVAVQIRLDVPGIVVNSFGHVSEKEAHNHVAVDESRVCRSTAA